MVKLSNNKIRQLRSESKRDHCTQQSSCRTSALTEGQTDVMKSRNSCESTGAIALNYEKRCAACQEHQGSNMKDMFIPHEFPTSAWQISGTDLFNFDKIST